MPKVSVIIPVYNVEQYIERCARSLFEQTLDDLEYIFINDCTPDNSMDVLARTLEDYPSRRNQVKIIEMPINSGLAKVRKIGMEAASGDYIIYCDSDDWVDTTIYEKMWAKAVTEKSDMVICGYAITEGTIIISEHFNDLKGFKSLKHAIIADQIQNFTWNKLIRRELFNRIKQWPKYNLLEDVAMITPIAYHCRSIEKIDEPLYFYYKNNDSICNTTKGNKKAEQVIANTCIAIRHINNNGGRKEFRKEIAHRKCLVKTNCWDIAWLEYIRLFPEVNISLFFDSNITIPEKLGHLTKCLGIHGLSKMWKNR